MESHRLARMEIYSRITGQGGTGGQIVLPNDYARQEAPFAAQQLEKAGVRLATVLNGRTALVRHEPKAHEASVTGAEERNVGTPLG